MDTQTSWTRRGLRGALAIGFLSAVADRFGGWGPPGTAGIAWGDFSAFAAYTAQLNPWCPALLAPALAAVVTVLELGLAVLLVLDRWTVIAAWASCALLAAFAVAMTGVLGAKVPLDYSVFSASAAGAGLAVLSRDA